MKLTCIPDLIEEIIAWEKPEDVQVQGIWCSSETGWSVEIIKKENRREIKLVYGEEKASIVRLVREVLDVIKQDNIELDQIFIVRLPEKHYRVNVWFRKDGLRDFEIVRL